MTTPAPTSGQPPNGRPLRIALIAGFAILVAAPIVWACLSRIQAEELVAEDVHVVWTESKRLAGGVNPYQRIHDSDMRTNEKYATYLPVSYLVGAGVIALGGESFPQWLSVWKWVAMAFYLGVGAMVFVMCSRGDELLYPMIAAVFVLFNRWALYVAGIVHLDPIALFFLLLSLHFWLNGRRRSAAVMLGLSLAIKQMAAFVAPLYLVWAWVEADPARRGRAVASTLGWIVLIPAAVSAPFLIVDAGAFTQSMLFSLTRAPLAHMPASLDARAGLVGLTARLPMLALLLLLYGCAWKRRVSHAAAVLLALVIFVGFNSVAFFQYVLWPIALLPIALRDALPWAPAARNVKPAGQLERS